MSITREHAYPTRRTLHETIPPQTRGSILASWGVKVDDVETTPERACSQQHLSARAHAKAGFPVIWLPERDKNPQQSMGHSWGSKATKDLKVVDRWFEKTPDANVGIVVPCGYLVIDVDLKDGQTGGSDMVALLQVMREDGYDFPTTAIAVTPSGGIHVWLKVPKHLTFTKAGRLKMLLGRTTDVDLKHGNAQHMVVAPGSVLEETEKWRAGEYRWVRPPRQLAELMGWSGGVEIAQCPQWLLDLIAKVPAPERAKSEQSSSHMKDQGRTAKSLHTGPNSIPAAAAELMMHGNRSRTASQDAMGSYAYLRMAGWTPEQIAPEMADPRWTRLREHYSKKGSTEQAVVAAIYQDVLEFMTENYVAPIRQNTVEDELTSLLLAADGRRGVQDWKRSSGGSARRLLGALVGVAWELSKSREIRVSLRQGVVLSGLSMPGYLAARERLIALGWLTVVEEELKDRTRGQLYRLSIPERAKSEQSPSHMKDQGQTAKSLHTLAAHPAFAPGALGAQALRLIGVLLQGPVEVKGLSTLLGIHRTTAGRVVNRLEMIGATSISDGIVTLVDLDQLVVLLDGVARTKGTAYAAAKRARQMKAESAAARRKVEQLAAERELGDDYVAPEERRRQVALEFPASVHWTDVRFEGDRTLVRVSWTHTIDAETGEIVEHQVQQVEDADLLDLKPVADVTLRSSVANYLDELRMVRRAA